VYWELELNNVFFGRIFDIWQEKKEGGKGAKGAFFFWGRKWAQVTTL
jgi:hypothetical protein